jgi:hypothetical protein
VETNIVGKLDDILSPIKITRLAEDVITSVAGESEESRDKRKQLKDQLDVLEQGLGTCKRFMVRTLQGKYQARPIGLLLMRRLEVNVLV